MSQIPGTECSDLLRMARDGSSDALGQLLERYRKYLTTLARGQVYSELRGKADASDIVQETFLRAHEAFNQFRGASERELIAWLRTILASRLAKTVRRYVGTRKRAANLEFHLEQELERSSCSIGQGLAASGMTPSEIVSRDELVVVLASVIEDLPEDHRTVILLHHVQGRPHAEVAACMDKSIDSVKKMWVRALLELKRSVEKYT